ncbi:GAP family protein [Plantibacter sp. YIM 135347]|uniref:GAP family protein n=1 Tax=Plantibacter sp. YIM 135347 TaxID=3423919 RepID=UPI003D350395
MGPTIAELLPLATGILISPIPIAAMIAILLSPRARANALAFTATAFAVTAVITGLTALGSGGAEQAAGGSASGIGLVISLVVTVLFLVLAVLSWRGRPKRGEEPVAPSWLQRIDTLNPGTTAVLCILLTVPNAKNLPLALKAGSIIGSGHHGVLASVLLVVAFGIASTLALIALSTLAASTSAHVRAALDRAKAEMIAHNAVILTVLFLVLAAVQASHAIVALTSGR